MKLRYLLTTLFVTGTSLTVHAQTPETWTVCRDSVDVEPLSAEVCEQLYNAAEQSDERAKLASILAWVYARQDRFENANRVMDTIGEAHRSDLVILGNIANVQLLQGNFGQAVATYSTVLDGTPPLDIQAAALLYRSLAFRGLGRFDEAAEDFATYTAIVTPPAPMVTAEEAISPINPEALPGTPAHNADSDPSAPRIQGSAPDERPRPPARSLQ